ncbi:MAG: DUF3352 domain-containing protein, partial [Verrucomicrobia bacterium]|nr:DUF3352 domain-containing protein [Verrucomicrobiota bacterium]
YMYLGTAQWLENLSGKTERWRQTFESMPALKPEQEADINKAFDTLSRVIKDSGIEDVTGVGLSSIEIEPGLYRNKAVLHHYSGKGAGFLWQLGGSQAHPLSGLNLLPDDTAFAVFSDANVPLLWSVLQKEVNASNIPKAREWLQKIPDEFQKRTEVNWDQFLKSLGGEFGLVLTLDPSNNVPVPVPRAAGLQIPAPALMVVLKVNDDTIFNRIDVELKKNPRVVAVDNSGFKMRTMPVPLPLPIQLRPSAASSGGYLFIASSDSLIEDALAVKGGQKPGLTATAEFKHLSRGIPTEGNQFGFVSRRFGETVLRVQKQIMAAGGQNQPARAQWLQSLFQSRPAFAYSVSVNGPEGLVTTGNSSQSYAAVALMPGVAVGGLLAAIAVPNFVKAREAAQRNACINNLRMIDGAKNEWALENRKTTGAVPTREDLLPYLSGRRWPVCPSGGTYTMNPIGQPPACSVPGHKLPSQ